MKVGDTVGPYSLLKRLGVGSFGVVWKAHNARSNREVAIKIIEPDEPEHFSDLFNAFLREVHTWSQVSGHPNIHSLESPEHHDGCLLLVSACADGSLRDWLRNPDKSARKIPVKEAVEMTCGLLKGLEHLHTHRPVILHRDLKPENVLLFGGQPRLADFGLSVILEGSRHHSQASGTLPYMAPENFEEEFREESDQWAIGVMLYEMLMGHLPFANRGGGPLIGAILNRDSQPLSDDIPPDLQAVVMHALQKDYKARYASVTEMHVALESILHPVDNNAEKYRKAAEEGNSYAQYCLGICYETGNGVPQDHNQAFKWYREAKDGTDVPDEWIDAVKWYRKAAEQGDALSQKNLAWCYANGKGVPEDDGEAVKWYRKAAEQGETTAQNSLGVCYQDGKGVAQDYTEAVQWYRKAAEQGNASAQNNLGWCYQNGNGVAKNHEEATKWYQKAAELRKHECKGGSKPSPTEKALFRHLRLDSKKQPTKVIIKSRGKPCERHLL